MRRLGNAEILGDIKKVVLVTNETEQEVKALVEKVSKWKNKILTCTDNIEWTDLTLAHQEEIEQKLKETFKVELEDGVDGKCLADLINGKDIEIFKETLPEPISFYVDRTLRTRSIISNDIFEQNCRDIFLFRGMERYQLSALAKCKMTGNSTEYFRGHTKAQYLLLDKPSHLQRICNALQNENVHLLEHNENGKLKWISSQGDLGTIQKCVDYNSQLEYNEESLCSTLLSKSNQPICISDGPGMGKSVLLAQIGRRLSLQYPGRLVFYVALRDIMKLANLKLGKEKLDARDLETNLIKLVCENIIGEAVFRKNLQSTEGVSIELLLDGLDEVDSTDSGPVLGILEEIWQSFNSVRLWITTRLHLLDKLENTLNVLGLNILPFLEENQVDFLTSLWLRETRLNEDKIREFAQLCLKSLKSQIDGFDNGIAGIPLQCLLIGEVYEEDALEYVQFGSSSSPLEISSNVVFYEKIVERKFGKFESISGISKSTGNIRNKGKITTKLYDIYSKSKFRKYFSSVFKGRKKLSEEKIMRMHAHLAIAEIFPEYVEKLTDFLAPVNTDVVLKVGILATSRTSHVPRFLHRTFAEYFVAWFLISNLTKDKAWTVELSSYFMDVVLARRRQKFDLTVTLGDAHREATEVLFSFYFPILGNFLNALLDPYLLNTIPANVTNLLVLKAEASMGALAEITYACIKSDYVCLFKLFHNVKVIMQTKNATTAFFDEHHLRLAIYKSSLPLIDIIISKLEEQSGFSPALQEKALKWAVQREQFTILEFLLKEKVPGNILERSSAGIIGLIFLCLQHSTTKAPWILNRKKDVIRLLTGINPKLLDVRGPTPQINETPLLFGLRNQFQAHRWLLVDLVRLGADVLPRDKNNDTVLHMSLHKKHLSNEDFQFFMDNIPDEKLKELVRAKNNSGETPLMTLVGFQEPLQKNLEKFAKMGADFNCVNSEEVSILGFAIMNGRSLTTIQNLMALGASSSFRGSLGESIFHIAAWHGNLEAVNHFIYDLGMDINVKDKQGLTPLNYAMNSDWNGGKRLETGMSLFIRGAEFKKSNWLHYAASVGNPVSVRLMLEIGIDVNTLDNQGNTPLHLATQQCEVRQWDTFSTTEILIDKGANLEILSKLGETPLHAGVKNDWLDMKTFMLLWSTSDIGKMNSTCATLALRFAIFEAISYGIADDCEMEGFYYHSLNNLEKPQLHLYLDHKEDVVEGKETSTRHIHPGGKVHHLVETKGANVQYKNRRNETFLHMAAIGGIKEISFQIIKYLISHGAEVCSTDGKNQTFLHPFTSSYPPPTPSTFHDMVEFLVTGERDYSSLFQIREEEFGKTPLHLAMCFLEPKEETLALMHSHGADFNALDKDGHSILSYAVMGSQNMEIISKLIDLGADPKFVNTKTKSNMLHIAAAIENLLALQYFLQRGELDINGVDRNGYTPVDLAVRNRRGNDISELLRENGAIEGIHPGNGELTTDTKVRNWNMRKSRHFSGPSSSITATEECKLS